MSAVEDFESVACVCTGIGQFDTHAERLNSGRPNLRVVAGQPYGTTTIDAIFALVEHPPSVPKERASWIIPSDYSRADARSHEAQRQHGAFWLLPLDIDTNDLSIEDVDDALVAALGDVARAIYATRSSKPGNRKWRALVPLSHSIAGADYSDTVNAFYDSLQVASAGVIIPDRKLAGPGQLIYLPNRGDHYEQKRIDRDQLCLTSDHPVILRREANRRSQAETAAEARRAREQRASAPRRHSSVVDAYNARFTVQDRLMEYLYESDGDNYRSPHQQSGSFATRDYGEYWVSLSDSDAQAAIGQEAKNGQRFGDSFDLFVHYEHGGDFNAAVRAYGRSIGSSSDDFENHAIAPQGSANARPAAIATVDFKTLLTEVVVEEPDYIEPNFACPGNFVLIAGPPKAQKSFLLQEALVACATGGRFLAGAFSAPRPLRVFYLQAEMNRKLLRNRARAMSWLDDTQRDLLAKNLIVSERFHMLLDKDGVETAVQTIKAAFPVAPPDIIAIDPFVNMFDGDNENDNAQVMRFLQTRIERVRQRINPAACVIVVHHATKKGADDMARDPFACIRGAGALRGYYDSAVVIYRRSEEDRTRKVHFELRGGEAPPPMELELVHGRFVHTTKPRTEVDRHDLVAEAMTLLEMADGFPRSWSAVRAALVEDDAWPEGKRFSDVTWKRWMAVEAESDVPTRYGILSIHKGVGRNGVQVKLTEVTSGECALRPQQTGELTAKLAEMFS